MIKKIYQLKNGIVITTVMLLLASFTLNAQRLNPQKNTLVRSEKKATAEKFTPPTPVTYTRDGVTVTTLVNDYMYPYDISQSGQHIAGQGFGEASSFYWSETTGMIPITGTCFSVSETGIVGGYYSDATLGASVAGLWDPATQSWTFLGMNPNFPELNSDYNSVWGMNSAGTICVGMQFNSAWMAFPFKWTFDGGYEILSYPANAYTSRPDAVCSDGSVICGHIDWNPAVWHNGTYTIISQDGGEAFNVSPNGLYVVGSSGDNGFIWNSSTQTTEFFTNTLQTGSLTPTCVTDNGTIFGYAATGFPPSIYSRVAFVRLPDGTMHTFNEYAGDRGLVDADQWSFYSINSVTADGNAFIGAGITPDGITVSFKMAFESVVYNCNPPSNLTYEVTEENWNDILLSWEAPENATNVTYNIYANASETTPLFTGITGTTYTDMDKPAGTYTYVVRANWSDTCLSSATNKVTVSINSCAPSEMCNLIFDMVDAYGDGWNGGEIQVINVEGTLLATVTLNSGSSGQETIAFCPDLLNFFWEAGQYDEECTFTISNEYGVTIYSQTTTPVAGLFLNYDHACTPPETVDISGNVTALSDGSPIANASVVFDGLLNPTATTDANGFYSLNAMIGQTYNIIVNAAGYNTYTQTDYVAPTTATTMNFQMTAPILSVSPTSVSLTTNYLQNTEATITLSNTGNGPVNFTSDIAYSDNGAKNSWELIHSFSTSFTSEQGICTDGEYFYTCYWNGNGLFGKYDLQGLFMEQFTIDGIGAIRDLTYDGTYFYGGDGTSTLYTLDLANHTLVAATTTGVSVIRHCSYDPDNDGFWIGDWTNLFLVNRAGDVVQTGQSISGAYGSGYDNLSEGGPYLLFHCQPSLNTAFVFRYKIATGEFTQIFDMSATPGYDGGTAGGAYIGEYASKMCFIGNIQQSPNLVAIYELGSLGWLSLDPGIGTIPAGGTQEITLTGDGWFAESGQFNAVVTFSGVPAVEAATLNVDFTIIPSDCDAPTNLTAELSDWSNIALSWTAPENPTGVTYNIYTSASSQTPIATGITETNYLVEDLPTGIYTFIVRAVWSDGCVSTASNMVEIETFPCDPESMCQFTIDMADSYGDGWNGASITVTNDGTQIASITLENAATGQSVFSVCQGILAFSWVSGIYDDECSFTITNSFGTVIYTCATPPSGGTFLSFNNTCSDAQQIIVSGIVSNEADGTPIANADIVFNGTESLNTTSNSAGFYEIELTSGFIYDISVSATGYETFLQNDFTAPDENTTLDFELSLTPCNMVPENVAAIAIENDITVTWELPNIENWLSWTGTYENNSIGTGSAVDFDIAQRFEPDDLSEFDETYLTKVQFIPADDGLTCEYSVRVWTGGSAYQAGNLVVDQVIPSSDILVSQWNEVTLNTPVLIDATQELWFGIRCNTTTGYPAGCDAGPALIGKGDLIYMNGAWDDLVNLASTLNFNWCLKGLVTNQVKGIVKNLVTLQDKANRNQKIKGLLDVHPLPTATKAATPAYTYNVYRDGVKIAEGLSEMTYIDNNLENGTYCYTVSSTCENGVESAQSEEACETVSTGIDETASAYEVFPNPANNSVSIKGSNIESIAVYNILGQKIDHVVSAEESYIINTTAYANGVYIFRIITNDGQTVAKRVVIAH